MKLALFILTAALTAHAQSPWNATWKLDPARSTPGAKDMAAEDYRFTVSGDGKIRWEIPSLNETNNGKTDGTPFPINRDGKPSGSTLSVTKDGPYAFTYTVAHNGKTVGGGRMTLVEGGKAWVDLTYGANPQGVINKLDGAELVYVRR